MKNLYSKVAFLILVATFFSKCINAQTYVSGHITSDTTWALAGNPYIVLDTLYVDSGNTLTIEPGVTVKVKKDKFIMLNDANLIAIGTINDSITFTTDSALTAPALWNGIGITNYNNSLVNYSKFNYCKVLCSASGIGDRQGISSLGSDSLSIKNSYFSNNSIAVVIGGQSKTLIDSCVFKNNAHGCDLYPQAPSVTATCILRNSLFSGNNYGIAVLYNPKAPSDVRNCRIENSGSYGIYAGQSPRRLLVADCIIRGNNIGVYPGYVDCIVNCLIDSSIVSGIHLQGSGSSIIGCTIKNNNMGINHASGAESTISKNIIEGNNIGFFMHRYIVDSIYCNKIWNNNYNFKTDTLIPTLVNVSNNDWGTTDTALIAAGIFDGNDDSDYALVNFLPIDTIQCYQSPCNLILSESTTNATCQTCADGLSTANVFNGFPPYSYTWNTSPTQTLLTAVNLLPGNYSVCVTDIYGCTVCDTVNVLSGNCSALFNLYADTIPHHYLAQNLAYGTGVLSYSWDWGDASPNDTIAFPSHTYSIPGFYTICQTISDATGCANTYCNTYNVQHNTNTMVYVSVIPGISTGLENHLQENELFVYPNPSTSLINVVFPDSKNKRAEITIYNVLREVEFNSTIALSDIAIDITKLDSGIHVVEVKSGNQLLRKKFIKL